MNAYFTAKDEQNNKIYDFTIPDAWWSRLYEYIWCKRLIIPGETVLDAGSGPNYPFQYELAENGCKVFSVDLNPDLLNSKPHPNIEHIVASIDAMPVPSGSIDTVYCISVLEHLPYDMVKKVLAEFYRVLKLGGRLVLTLDITMDGRYSCIRKPEQLFNIAEGFKYGEYQRDAPPDAIRNNECGLYCYHAILTKEAV
jgi:ubiquinone/menaquinone biosynthesis C-methylase UbiE